MYPNNLVTTYHQIKQQFCYFVSKEFKVPCTSSFAAGLVRELKTIATVLNQQAYFVLCKTVQLQSGQKTVCLNKNAVSEGLELFKEILYGITNI